MKLKKETTKKDQRSKKNTLYNNDMPYKARNEVIKFFNDYISMVSEAKNKAKNKTSVKRLKILTPKQLLQRLRIALAQVKTGNSSENLSNKIRQIVYFLYQSKKITKKYTAT